MKVHRKFEKDDTIYTFDQVTNMDSDTRYLCIRGWSDKASQYDRLYSYEASRIYGKGMELSPTLSLRRQKAKIVEATTDERKALAAWIVGHRQRNRAHSKWWKEVELPRLLEEEKRDKERFRSSD